MAFFKLPWSAKKAPPATKPGKGSQALRGETVEAMRRRARHRLMGASLLVVLAVVGFPVLFDSQPRSIPVDARIEIPDRDNVAPLVVPSVADTAAAQPQEEVLDPLPAASTSQQSGKSKLKVMAEGAASQADSAAYATKASTKASSAESSTKEKSAPLPAFVEARTAAARTKNEPPVVVVAPTPSASASANSQQLAREQEADRARALLEGRSGKVSAQPPTIPVASADAERFIVQVGAFSDDSKVREARAKLERGGLTTYTQAVQTKDGKRTRVRVGPFTGRQDAERAAAKIKALGLPAAVLSL